MPSGMELVNFTNLTIATDADGKLVDGVLVVKPMGRLEFSAIQKEIGKLANKQGDLALATALKVDPMKGPTPEQTAVLKTMGVELPSA